MTGLVVALAKGRLLDQAVDMLARVGIAVSDLDSRKLRVADEAGSLQFLLVKPSDVPTYVEYGAADAGICGRDVLMESQADVYEPLDLGVGSCRLVVAGKAGESDATYRSLSLVRVATKYPRSTERHFHGRGVPVELVRLSGSVELAPLVGLADHIVDLVETGTTLRANGLEVREIIAESTARLIVNRAAFATKRDAIGRLIGALREAKAARPQRTRIPSGDA
ncbi:MAG: ATP phosphoribosyltransferase [Candidatus Sericytochromatia bacterium]|uniref:ATP phosphoribosyltransferase n=1 Tax=Candidatus Tanganyikabacteria bacterium TaxID=2961651 RepID=A0A938BM68_9BACT|nr:ATP phosphoribosyltransferase [Candidatus Tanganyikabacteria bacterium]